MSTCSHPKPNVPDYLLGTGVFCCRQCFGTPGGNHTPKAPPAPKVYQCRGVCGDYKPRTAFDIYPRGQRNQVCRECCEVRKAEKKARKEARGEQAA